MEVIKSHIGNHFRYTVYIIYWILSVHRSKPIIEVGGLSYTSLLKRQTLELLGSVRNSHWASQIRNANIFLLKVADDELFQKKILEKLFKWKASFQI